MKIFIIIFTGITLILSSCISKGVDDKIYYHLEKNYGLDLNETKAIIIEEHPIFYDTRKLPTLNRIDANHLEQLTGYQFRKTTLKTSFIQYPEIMMIIAVPAIEDLKIKELLSPTFIDPSELFLDIFKDLNLTSLNEKELIVKEIYNIFEQITPNGKIMNVKTNNDDYSCELWVGELKFRKLKFNFEENKLENLKIQVMNEKSLSIEDK